MGTRAHGNSDIFSNGLSCHEVRTDCPAKQAKEICEEKRAICQSLIRSGAIAPNLATYLVNCEKQTTCIIQDSKAMLEGCSKLGISGWEKVQNHLLEIKNQLDTFEQSCAQKSSGQKDPKYRQCLLQKIPSIRLPDNLDFLFNYFESRFNSLTGWFMHTKGIISKNIANECEHLRNRPDQTFSQCRFTSFMNGLLENLEKPYASSPFKSITDLLVEAYVVRVSEHSKSSGCLTPDGMGREFCSMLVVLSTKTVQAALETSDLVPNPKSIAKNFGRELLDEGKEVAESATKVVSPPTLRRQKGADLPEELKKKYLSKVSKSLDEIELDDKRDWEAMTSGPKRSSAGRIVWPRSFLAKKQADELAVLFREGQKIDFDTKNPVERAKIMAHFKKVAELYAEIYRSQGYEVSLLELRFEDSDQLGGYRLVFESSANPKVVGLLSALYDKQNVKELVINVDRNFFDSKKSGAAYIPGSSPIIEIDASGMQDPSQLLKRDSLFHEIHHGHYEKSKFEHKNLPYFGFADIKDSSHGLISLSGYDHEFHAEEIAAYRKQLSITQSEKMQPTANRDDLKLEIRDKNERTAEVALRYREASRSTLRVIDNIEQSMNSSSNYLKSIKFDIHDILDRDPSTATLPLYNTNKQKIGEFTLHLVNLNSNEPSDKEAIVKAYLQQMKEAATKDYLDAQAKIEFLKQKAISDK